MKSNFWYLLGALAVFIVGVPIATDLDVLSPVIVRALGFSSLLAIGIWSLRSSGRTFSAAMALAVAGVTLSLLATGSSNIAFLYGSIVALLAFLMLATSVAAKKIALDPVISGNRIVGAICVYLMLGVIWALIYALLESAMPGSFKGLSESAWRVWNTDWVYFSFITMSTLGYGDILPISSSARALAYLEAIVGQFYIAILVAGLVSSYITARLNPPSE